MVAKCIPVQPFRFFAAFEISETRFYRTGNVRNGLFPDDSYGRSVTNIFKNRAFKAGITYKINGRNYIYANVADITRPPYFDNAYISPRTRDFEQPALSSESIQSAEAGYILNAPKIKLRIGGYYTAQNDALNVLTFYHETYRSFVNYALSNIDKLYVGGEFGFEASAAKTFRSAALLRSAVTIIAAASMQQSRSIILQKRSTTKPFILRISAWQEHRKTPTA